MKQQNWLNMRRFQSIARKLWSTSTNRKDLKAQDPHRMLSGRQVDRHPQIESLYKGGAVALALATLTAFAACTYKSPGTETPVPSETETTKSFFVTTKVDPKTGKTINVPRTFLCGWASEMETGWAAEATHTNNAIMTDHCNVVFEITESKLLGKLINPSFPNDPNRWEVVLTIPIKSHYYTEAEKDGAGRDTNRIIRNTSRSHWSARPNMDLDLDSMNFQTKWASWEFWGSHSDLGNINVEKVEWDTKNGFLGFTINRGSYGSSYARLRFNFKAFETNPEFKATPFNDKNYKRMNVLHIIGEKVNGLYPILHAAHWDLTKKHEVRLWHFPEAYKDIVKEVVNDWNEALRKAEATTLTEGPFIVSDEPAEHAFDLRHPTIAWIADEKISSYSPLGIGMALADVKNGEIQWGMITLYGGMIESYIKSYSPNSVDSSAAGKIAGQILSRLGLPASLELPPAFRSLVAKMGLPQSQSEKLAQSLNGLWRSSDKNKSAKPSAEELKAEVSSLQENIQGIFNRGVQLSQSKIAEAKSQTSNEGFAALMRKNMSLAAEKESDTVASEGSQKKSRKTLPSAARKNQLIQKFSSPQFCQGRTFEDVGAGWAKALSAGTGAQGTGNSIENDKHVLRNVIKELTSHEYGHFLGLGHQFKENILPAKGSVPDSIYNSLSEKARAEKHFTNYSSVMGYRSPRVEMAEIEGVKPGPQDILVLRFLYKQQFATYKTGDADFSFANVPANGIIPDANPEKPDYKTSYFPQCNDIEASLAIDPYCNRFDSGPTATAIMKNYFSDLTDTLPQNLFAFTDARGGCPECIEAHLWYKSFLTLGRTRVFYDYMRLYFRNEIDRIRSDENALMDFSKACQSEKVEKINNATLKQIFTEKPQLKELCQANAIALREMKNLVSNRVPDFTKMDVSGKFMPGGMDGGDAERDWSRWTGSWTEMTGLPFKTAALYALTTGVPWATEFGMMATPLYDDPNFRFSYSYLYPREYTEIIAANVKNNLSFASLAQTERTSMGRSVLSMGWMNETAQYGNNDAALFPPQFVEKIRNQQQFSLGLVAILMKGRDKEDNPNFVDSWEGQVYDMALDKTSPLTNAYILPGGTVIASSPGMFLYPVTKFTPYSDKEGYLFAYKLEYSRDTTDSLSEFSVKTDLKELHDRLVAACVMGTDGTNNGLAHFFTSTVPDFKGFKMGTGLARDEAKRKEFLESIDEAYRVYYASKKTVKPETCRESIRGMGLIISSAAVLNGFWLPEVMDYIQK